jgi:hypothetical protein
MKRYAYRYVSKEERISTEEFFVILSDLGSQGWRVVEWRGCPVHGAFMEREGGEPERL